MKIDLIRNTSVDHRENKILDIAMDKDSLTKATQYLYDSLDSRIWRVLHYPCNGYIRLIKNNSLIGTISDENTPA